MYRPFTLHKRPTTKARKVVYYCQFRDKHGNRMTPISTGKSNKAEAYEWAQEKYDSGLTGRKSKLYFSEYVQDWFDWENCPYIKRKRTRSGYSRVYAEHQSRLLRRHITPYFAKMRLAQITGEEIEHWCKR